MKKCFLFITLVFFLTSCAFKQIESGLNALQGKNIDTAFNYLGYPDAIQDLNGQKIFVWGEQFSVTTTTAVTNQHYGNASTYSPNYGHAYGNYSGTSTSYVPVTHNYNCNIKIIANSEGIITGYQYKGNEGGCSSFGTALSKVPETPSKSSKSSQAEISIEPCNYKGEENNCETFENITSKMQTQ